MSKEQTPKCDICENAEGHMDDFIEEDSKAFCPNTFQRIFTEDEAEEMTDEELAEAKKERLVIVRPERYIPAKYKIVKEKES